MSKMRPEAGNANSLGPYVNPSKVGADRIDRIGALYAIYKSVARRRSLAFGALDDDEAGKHCAIGCFWEDNKYTPLPTVIVDEVAAVNDAVPADAKPKERWAIMMQWLRSQLGM